MDREKILEELNARNDGSTLTGIDFEAVERYDCPPDRWYRYDPAQMQHARLTWWWLSFADPKKPDGNQFLGVACVEAFDFISACVEAWRLGINPGGEVAGCPLPEPPEEALRNQLASESELAELGYIR